MAQILKRSPRTVFDDNGNKWYNSPLYKDVKTDTPDSEVSIPQIHNEFNDNSKLSRDRFYDFYHRVTKNGELRIDLDELNKSLNIKIEVMPDSCKVQEIYEKINSRSNPSKCKKNWGEDETILLVWMVLAYCEIAHSDYNDLSDNDWEYVASIFSGKKLDQIKIKWQSLLKINLSKAPWTTIEDDLLTQIVNEKGAKKWKEIASELNDRANHTKFFRQGKQCRERWINHLDPNINRGIWSAEEDLILLKSYVEIGKKWAEIAKRLKTRTENAVKNRYNSLIKKYKTDFDSGLVESSPLSNTTGASMDDVERRISEMLIDEKKKEMNEPQIPAINEEDEFNEKLNEDLKAQEEEEKKKKLTKKKSNGNVDINKFKNNLKEFVQEDNRQNKMLNMQNAGIKSPLISQGISQIQNTMSSSGIFNIQNKSEPLQPKTPIQTQMNQIRPEQMNLKAENPSINLFNQFPTTNDMSQITSKVGVGDLLNLNLLMMNSNNLNVYTNNIQTAQNLESSISPPLSLLSSPKSKYKQPVQQANIQASFPNSTQGIFENFGSSNQNPSYQEGVMPQFNLIKEKPYTEEPKIHKYAEKPIQNFQLNESNNQQYAIIDPATGTIYILGQVNTSNFPPQFLNHQVNYQQQQQQSQLQQMNLRFQQQQQQIQQQQQHIQHQLQQNELQQQQLIQQHEQKQKEIKRGTYTEISNPNIQTNQASFNPGLLNNALFNFVKNPFNLLQEASNSQNQQIQQFQQLQQQQQEMANYNSMSNSGPKFESFNYTPELTPRQTPRIQDGQRMNYLWGNYKPNDKQNIQSNSAKSGQNVMKNENDFFS